MGTDRLPLEEKTRIGSVDINKEMATSFVDYSMSVIVSRALPDVRDGLKPVQRRIVYAMNDMGVRAGSPHRKSATVVGEVIGKYHPHSNDAIYDALVRMGQSFSLAYPLVDPQGNFGTNDDPPAAMRYTECRLTELASGLLDGIEEDTVDFIDNFDGSESEPTVLPSRFPNLLVNGSQGIAVGMATNIPPYNMLEITQACLYGLEHPDASAEDYLSIVKGPDFPTGGYVIGSKGIRDALTTGRGSVTMRAVTDIEPFGRGRSRIVVTELPYQVSQDRVMERIARLVQEKTVTGISDLRNESSSQVGIRLVVDLKKDANHQIVLNQLFKMTGLQENFGVNTVALVDGVPRTLNIADLIKHFLTHQMEVVERRTRFRLKKARDRAHILEGLIIAVDNIDAVIAVIRSSEDADQARVSLIDKFELTEVQARAILDMPLRRLTSLETVKLREEHAGLLELISGLESILADPAKMRGIIAEEMSAVCESHAEGRKTRLRPDENQEMSADEMIPDDDLVITASNRGYIKAVDAGVYRTQGRGGRGVKGADLGSDDYLTQVLTTTSHSWLLFFSDQGRVHRIKSHNVPRHARTAKGVMIHSVLPFEPDERIRTVIDSKDQTSSKYLVTVTRLGHVKRTLLSEYKSKNTTLVAVRLKDNDTLVGAYLTDGECDLMLFTRRGRGIRFAESDLRPMGRNARGSRGIRLRDGDEVVGAAALTDDSRDVLLLTSGGYGKRTKVALFRRQKRGGVGIKAYKLTSVRGDLIGAMPAAADSEVLLVSSNGVITKTKVAGINRRQRDSTGVLVQRLPAGVSLASFAPVLTETGQPQ